MIGCGIGVGGAKRMGEMLDKNASLKDLSLDGENPLNTFSSPAVVYYSSKEHICLPMENYSFLN
jgi:hypothetical protein